MRKSLLRRALLLLAFATSLPLASAANASVYLFNLTGPHTATFSLNGSPTPAATGTGFFTLQNVPGTSDGAATTFAQLSFFDAAHDGGYSLLGGPQLFTGTLASPTFTLGTFALSDDGFVSFKYNLSITDAASVPEPATWAMMLLGFAGIGLALRRRTRAAGAAKPARSAA
jgi:hypothetical protein